MDCNATTSPRRSGPADDDVDRRLLLRISGEDRAAFRQLYLDYQQRLTRFLVRITGRHGNVEDVINDTLLIVWRRAGDFHGASRVSTWIFGIAFRCASKAFRASTARSNTVKLENQDDEVAEDTARETENRQLLALGLARLPREQRIVLVLAYYMDYSCEEIAAISACSINTVKSRMFHARRKLRAIIGEIAAPPRAADRCA